MPTNGLRNPRWTAEGSLSRTEAILPPASAGTTTVAGDKMRTRHDRALWALLLTLGIGLPLWLLTATPADISAAPNTESGISPSAQIPDEPIVPGEILVRFRHDAPQGIEHSALAAFGATPTRRLRRGRIWRASVATGAERAIASSLTQNPWVVFAEPNVRVHGTFVPDDPDYNDPALVYGPQTVEAEAAWDITTGAAGVTVAILDSGVSGGHEDLTGRVLTGYDFVNDDNDPADDHGHGTHVAGIAAGTAGNTLGMAGIAQVDVLPVKVLDQNNTGTWADIADGITYAADNGADVINLSLGGYTNSATLESAVDYAYDAGIPMVAAAGNGANSNPFYPAYYTETLAIAATTGSDTRWSLSNYGTQIDMSAPGDTIWSTDWTSGNPTTGYKSRSGTSQAVPHVTGAAALLYSYDSSLTRDEIHDLLTSSAHDLGASGWDQLYGHGRLDINQALLDAGGSTPTPSPSATSTPSPMPSPTPTSAPYLKRAHGGSTTTYVDTSGQTWEVDQAYGGGWGYAAGSAKSSSRAVSGTSDDPLYQKYREAPVDYRFDVPNGDYEVTLHFAEFSVRRSGDRKMRVSIEGNQEENALDIYAEVGRYAALDRTYSTTVNDGQLMLQMTKNGGRKQPIISAIFVENVGGAGTETPTPSPTNTVVPTNTAVPTNTSIPTNTTVPTETPDADQHGCTDEHAIGNEHVGPDKHATSDQHTDKHGASDEHAATDQHTDKHGDTCTDEYPVADEHPFRRCPCG